MDRKNNSSGSLLDQKGRPVTALEAAQANDCFEVFLNASTLKTILGTYHNLCEYLHLKPNVLPSFYPKLKANLTSWRAKALWKKFDARANNKVYGKGKMCPNTRVLIIGAGPCGLRAAIEAQLLGAKVVVVEKRDRMSRNNVLHLWPFVIDDLRMLGAKKFFGKFCAGAIDHISIRQLQCVLLKVALLLGAEIHTEVSFERLIEPNAVEKTGWRAEYKPEQHPVSQFEFDVVIGADGKRNTLQGFKRKEFRGKLAIAITANFINKRTEAEARVEEISGVAFIFNQKFFKDLYADTGIDLENIVYYKDDTHYFVMTAKKSSLIDKGVIIQDLPDTARLLHPDNVDREALMNYAREAAEFSTNYNMTNLEFAVNHYGQPDVAMFDFTSMYAAENASRIIERCGYKLLTILVGDSLLEPFWPTGSGCARGFLSSLDAGWAIRGYGSGIHTPLEVLAERESIYRLLAQTTPENLNKDYKSYTLDPSTRYPNLNKNLLLPQQVLALYDTDNASQIEITRIQIQPAATEGPKKRRRRESHVDPDTLLSWIKEQIKEHADLQVNDITTSFRDGRLLCAIISHYRPDLLDYSAIQLEEPVQNNQLAFDILEKDIGIPPVMTGEEMVNSEVPDFLTMVSYLTQIYDTFRCEIPHIKHPKLKPVSNPEIKSLNLEKSKFSMVNRSIINGEYLGLEDLNLTPLKSIEEYGNFINPSHYSFSVHGDNSKSLIMKISFSDLKESRSRAKKSKTRLNPKRNKNIKEVIHKNLNALTKSAYIMESQILQSKIDAALGKCKKRKAKTKKKTDSESLKPKDNFKRSSPPPVPEFKEEKVAKERKDSRSIEVKKRGEVCECCAINKQNFAKEISEETNLPTKDTEIDIIITDDTKFENINQISMLVGDCVKIVFPRVIKTLMGGLGLNPVSLEKTKSQQSLKSHDKYEVNKLLSLAKMSHTESNKFPHAEQTFDRVKNWISASNFDFRNGSESPKTSSVHLDGLTDITSVTRQNLKQHNEVKTEAADDIIKFTSDGSPNISRVKTCKDKESSSSINNLKEELKNPDLKTQKFSRCPSKQLYEKRMKSKSEPPGIFSTIVENEENSCAKSTEKTVRNGTASRKEMPEPRRNESIFNKNHPAIKSSLAAQSSPATNAHSVHRQSSRHKRHSNEPLPPTQMKSALLAERKPRKRKTMEKLSITNVEDRLKRLEEIAQNRMERHSKRRQQRKFQTDQFIKSMQMLQANCKPDHSEPFEDYSIFLYRQTAANFEDRVKDLEKKFTYIPERENRMPAQTKGEKDEDFQARIKGMEDKWRETAVTEKKPKDLMRAIGKIDNTDWNIREIEKKIIENKMGKNVNKDKERVPKWSREQFLARQTKMEKQHLERQDSATAKYAEIDKNIKQLDQKLKEGTVRDMNQQKVAKITEKLKPKNEGDAKPIPKTNPKPVNIPTQGNSEVCHFCAKRVYLMERLSAEGKFFHRGCFRCQYCQTALRLGSYLYDRDGKYGYRFYCSQHFGMPGELKNSKVMRKPSLRNNKDATSPEKKMLSGVAGVDLLDRVQTPERIEFSNLSTTHPSSDHEESVSQMDEDEWTDRNFGASAAEMGSSEDESSSLSETDSDDEDAYEEALEEPPTKEGTLKWAERYNKRYSCKHDDSNSDGYSSSDQSSYYENSSGDDESDTATEGEEEIRARELRKQEVRVEPPVVHTDTGTDTEIASDETTSESSSEIQNSATEISTDSEFAHDDPTPTREVPSIIFNDAFVTKTRGKYTAHPQKVQIKTTEIMKPTSTKPQSKNIELKFTPLVLTPIVRKPPKPLLLQNEGYALNRTQSTGGIATKVSLELKKKYLLGEQTTSNTIQKSGSASTLDSKLKSFHSTISDCQKLLKPGPEISASMQTFCNKLNEQRTSPLSPLFSPLKEIAKPEEPKRLEQVKEPIIEREEPVKAAETPFENETEGRPRSPVHETSIIVPQIDWAQQKQILSGNSTASSSCSSTSSSSDSELNLQKSPSIRTFNNIPRLEVQDVDAKDLPLDSLNYDVNYTKLNESQPSSINDPPKSIASEKKVLNPPKLLPNLSEDIILNQVHSVLHNKPKVEDNSGRSTPSNNDSCMDQVTAVLTETELSDWAREGAVSDDFEDVEFELNSELESRRNKKLKSAKKSKNEVKKAAIAIAEFEDLRHVCGKNKKTESLTECVNSILNPDLDNIEFMDTGTESSDDGNVVVKNNGYVQFHDEDDIPEDSLSPVINIVEATNPKLLMKATFDEDFDELSTVAKNTGYCIIDNERNPFGGEVIDLKPTDLEKLKEKRNLCENEEDSLLIVDPGTTTEENTCSDSTVKNVTQIVPDKEKQPLPQMQDNINILDKKRLEDKLAQVKNDMRKLSEQRKAEQIVEQNLRNNIEFEQHCQRLQSKVDFGNAKDSIDIRKSRRQSKTGSPPKPDLIQEEKEVSPVKTRREQLEIERDMNKKLVQEMVMNKMKAQNKSLERKRRNRNSFSPGVSPSRPVDSTKFPQMNNPTPDVLLSTMNVPVQKSQTVSALSEFNKVTETKIVPRTKYSTPKPTSRPLSVHSALLTRTNESVTISDNSLGSTAEAFSLPDIHKALVMDQFDTPKAPPRVKNEEAKKIVERLKEDARARAKLLTDEDLGLSPEDRLAKLRQKVNKRGKENDVDVHIQDSIESLVMNTERRNSLLYSNDTLTKKKNHSFRRSKSGEEHLSTSGKGSRERTKSISDINKHPTIVPFKAADGEKSKFFKSDPNLLDVDGKKDKKKSKDRERRKSITKIFTDLFSKKKEISLTANNGNKGFLARISPKTRDKAKNNAKSDQPPQRHMSFTELRRSVPGNVSPPPIPPLPLNYTGTKSVYDSSDAESEWKQLDRSSCDTLDQSGMQDGSMCSRKSGRSARKAARQSQLKRHRMAQEIQRKLEETEVKTRELEQRGVCVEKALRGESSDVPKEETELLKEWFDLMRDMTELRRYERELMVRAQELELEDRHARLQHELKERLGTDGQKTQEDFETEGSIIKEMMDIVRKRDSLIALLEEDRIRYSEEDKGFEEQMLAKGINLTPLLMKVSEK